jgi:hypothetical protein
MNENDLYTILQRDDNLREAIRRREQKQSTMPADLNDRLMRRLEATPSLPPRGEERTKNLRWMAAAACLLIIIGIGVALMPSKESPSSGEFAIRQDGVGDLKSPETIKNHRIANPNTQDSRITNSTEPKAMAVAESKTVRKSKKKAAPIQTASIEQKDSSLFTLHSSLQKNDSSLITLHSSLKPAVLTERDIPITRPENYRYTPEEIALLKKQADDAYVKWVQLELEIAKYNLEQMAQQ